MSTATLSAVCKRCDRQVELKRALIRSVVDTESGKRVNYVCPFCYKSNSIFLTWEQMRSMARKSKESKDDRRREIGLLVKGFAVDLEAVSTLEDIAMFWIYQAEVRPWTIPREAS